MACCAEAGCCDQAFRELTDEEILALDFDPDFDKFLIELQQQEEVRGLSLENVLDDAAPDDYNPFVPDGISGENRSENRSESFQRSPPESVDNESCHVSGSVACNCAGHMMFFDGECQRAETQQDSSLRPDQQESTEEMRSQRVKERNRLYAARTRQRKNRMMQDLRQRCQDLEAENYELRTRVLDLEAQLASVYDIGGPVLRDSPMLDAHGACSPQTSDGSGASVRAKAPVTPSAPASAAVQFHRGQPSNTKAANKLRFTAAAASRRTALETKPSPASTFSGGIPECLPHSPCHFCGATGQCSHTYSWSLPPGPASAVGESTEQQQAAIPLQGTQLKRRPAGPASFLAPSTKNLCVTSAAGQGRLPAQGLVTSAMMVVIALSCIVLMSIPALHLLIPDNEQDLSSAAGVPRPNDNMHGRALLSLSSETDEGSVLALAPLSDARVMPYASWHDGHEGDAGPWMAASDDAEQILESAAFVCNHTACVAIPVDGAWADVVPMQPLELRPEQPGARDTLDEAVFSTLEDVSPAADKVAGGPVQSVPNASLRGGGFVGGEAGEEEEDCGGVSCFSFQHLAGKAMNMAGLMSPEMCELVHRTTFSPGVMGGSDIVTQQPPAQSGYNAAVPAQHTYGVTAPMVQHHTASRGKAPDSHGRTSNSSQNVENTTSGGEAGDITSDQMLSVLFPVWADDASDDSALTPIRHMYVFVLDQQDLLTYQCSMSRPLYM